MKKYKKMAEVRTQKGYTLAELAKILGISTRYLWDIEQGNRTLSYTIAYKISKILSTTPDELFLEDFKRK